MYENFSVLQQLQDIHSTCSADDRSVSDLSLDDQVILHRRRRGRPSKIVVIGHAARIVALDVRMVMMEIVIVTIEGIGFQFIRWMIGRRHPTVRMVTGALVRPIE